MERESRVADRGTPTAAADPVAQAPIAPLDAEPRTIHRIGGASMDNLRLSARDAALDPPGISVIKAATPAGAAEEMRAGYPNAKSLHDQAKTIGSASTKAIEQAGFAVISARSKRLPNHHRIIHPSGAVGFSDENLTRLAEAFVNTTGN